MQKKKKKSRKAHCWVCPLMWFVYSCFGMRLLSVWCRQKGMGARLDLCLQQNALCSLHECVNAFVREENTGWGAQLVTINSVYK